MKIERIEQMAPAADETSLDLLNHRIHNPDDQGWPFGCGDPELYKYRDRLVVPNGRALDLGIGAGRVSVMFAFSGMQVVGYDTNNDAVEAMNNLAVTYNVPIEARLADITMTDLGEEEYDLALLSELFYHFPNKAAAMDVIDRTAKALKPGGNIWIRALGKEDSSYAANVAAVQRGYTEQVDNDTLLAPCGCTGIMQMEPHLYFDQTDLLQYFVPKGYNIVHSQTLPQYGKRNILYGEDFVRDWDAFKTHGYVSILAQKPFEV